MLRLFSKSIRVSGRRMMSKSVTTLGKKPPLDCFGVVGKYVSALYSAAAQMNQLEETEKHLKELQKLLLKPAVVDFMESSMISRAGKDKLLRDISKEAGMPEAASNFLGVVAENGRLKLLRKMITMFLAVMVAHRKESLCEVITAEPLDDSTRQALISALKNFVKDKNITLTEKVDEKIIGGMIVGIEDKHIDMSIARKIQMYTDILQRAL